MIFPLNIILIKFHLFIIIIFILKLVYVRHCSKTWKLKVIPGQSSVGP